jgi:hypothetical protein
MRRLLQRHTRVPEVHWIAPCPTINTEYTATEANVLREIFIRHDPIDHNPVESLGYGGQPRLSKEFRKNLSQHVYYLKKFGPSEHSRKKKFDSVVGIRNHVFGLAYYAKQIDLNFGKGVLADLNAIPWPV